jgi:ABC-type branched-subunit amino acid transport system substrate-binding protein
MTSPIRSPFTRLACGLALSTVALGVHAQKKYDTGATDTEIKIGNTIPYSGPASTYAAIGKAMSAYFDMINAEGGVNGRKITFISLDDGYNPAKTVEQTRKLVEQEGVLFMLSPLGTAQNSAIHKYLNQKKVPHLFVSSGGAKWNDPKNFPWTIGWNPSYETEGTIYAKHLLDTKPNAKVAVLYQNDDFGKDYLRGFKAGLGAKAKDLIIAEASFEATDPTIDSQLVSLKTSGADTIVYFATPKQAAQAIKKVGELGWRPTQYVSNVSIQVEAVLKPAGIDNARGLISVAYLKEPSDPQWQKTPEYVEWLAWMKKYNPGANLTDNHSVYGYSEAQLAVQVLRKAGDNLTRENVMKQAANLDTTLPMLLPGISVKTTPDDFGLIKRLQLITFNGSTWDLTGKTYSR